MEMQTRLLRRPLFLVLLLGATLLLAGCRVYVLQPLFGSTIVSDHTDIRIRYEAGDTIEFSVTLNGEEIGDLFTHTGPSPDGWMMAEALDVPVIFGQMNQLVATVVIDGQEEIGVSMFMADMIPDPSGPVDESGRAGGFVDLTLDRYGLPHISYYDAQATAVRYARFRAATGFESITLYGFGDDPAGHFSQIIVRDDDSAVIAFHDEADGTLKLLIYRNYYYETFVVDGDPDNVVGLYPSMVLAPSGELWITYYDLTNGLLKLAIGDENGFVIHVVDGDAETDVGMWSNLYIAPDGMIQMAYYDNTNKTLRYAEGYQLPLDIVTVPDTGWYGSDCAMGVLANGEPVIAYFNETTLDLMFASRNGGVWTTVPVLTEGATGFFNSLVVDQESTVWIAFCDLSAHTLMLAHTTDLIEFMFDELDYAGPDSDFRYTSILVDVEGYLGIAYCNVLEGTLWYRRWSREPGVGGEPPRLVARF
jgi:hypothetical protein